MPEPPGGRAVAGPAGSVASHPQLPSQPSLDLLPPYIQAEAQLRSQRAWVRQQIQELLIEDTSDGQDGQSCAAGNSCDASL